MAHPRPVSYLGCYVLFFSYFSFRRTDSFTATTVPSIYVENDYNNRSEKKEEKKGRSAIICVNHYFQYWRASVFKIWPYIGFNTTTIKKTHGKKKVFKLNTTNIIYSTIGRVFFDITILLDARIGYQNYQSYNFVFAICIMWMTILHVYTYVVVYRSFTFVIYVRKLSWPFSRRIQPSPWNSLENVL